MKNQNWYRAIAVLILGLALSLGIMTRSQREVKAAPSEAGTITGTIKLDGTAPHQRPIDMSKEPYCQNLHKANPVTTETVVAGPDGGLKNVVVYVSEGISGAAASQVA